MNAMKAITIIGTFIFRDYFAVIFQIFLML